MQTDMVKFLVETGLVRNRGEARRAIAAGGVFVSGKRVDPEFADTQFHEVNPGDIVRIGNGKRLTTVAVPSV